MWVQSLEDPLEKEMATHFSILAWEIPWTEEPGGIQSMGLQRVGHDWRLYPHTQGHPGGISRLDLKRVPSPRSKEVSESID